MEASTTASKKKVYLSAELYPCRGHNYTMEEAMNSASQVFY